MLVSGSLLADKPDRRHDPRGRFVFSPEDERTVYEYYGRRPFRLPPGLDKKISRTGKMPPGWRKKIGPLAYELERRLSPLECVDCERGVIEGCAVIYNPHTHAVFSAISI